MFTQCPKCETIFQVSAEQLKAANGDVRCGQCLGIFSALDNLSEEIPFGEEFILDNNFTETETHGIPADHYQAEPVETTNEADLEIGVKENIETSIEFDNTAEQLEDALPEPETPLPHIPGAESAINLSSEDDIADTFFNLTDNKDEEVKALAEFFSDVADGTPDAAVSDTLPVPGYEVRVKKVTPAKPVDGFYFGANEATIEQILLEKDADLSEFTKESDDSDAHLEDSTVIIDTTIDDDSPTGTSSEQKKQISNVPSIILEELQAEKAAQLKAPRGPWLVGEIILMVVLVLQASYFSRNDLAKDPAWRPTIVAACEALGCSVAVPYDINLIEIIGRDVRSHPSAKKALIAGTTLINNAKFTQPYPLLTLTFSDITGTKLAQRRFTPREYLRNGADIPAGMAPDLPIQVELELVDPGKAAVNFEFHAEIDPRT